MISYIKGTIAAVGENFAVIENNGIGFRLFMPGISLASLYVGAPDVKLYTYMAVREDDISLFGFTTKDELEMFTMLIQVSGVGPKGAIGILSSMTVDTLRLAIAAEDPKLIAQAKGVGKKTAEKIVIELKGKVDKSVLEGSEAAGTGTAAAAGSVNSEALEVLLALGFNRSAAQTALSEVADPDATPEQLVAAALRVID